MQLLLFLLGRAGRPEAAAQAADLPRHPRPQDHLPLYSGGPPKGRVCAGNGRRLRQPAVLADDHDRILPDDPTLLLRPERDQVYRPPV